MPTRELTAPPPATAAAPEPTSTPDAAPTADTQPATATPVPPRQDWLILPCPNQRLLPSLPRLPSLLPRPPQRLCRRPLLYQRRRLEPTPIPTATPMPTPTLAPTVTPEPTATPAPTARPATTPKPTPALNQCPTGHNGGNLAQQGILERRGFSASPDRVGLRRQHQGQERGRLHSSTLCNGA